MVLTVLAEAYIPAVSQMVSAGEDWSATPLPSGRIPLFEDLLLSRPIANPSVRHLGQAVTNASRACACTARSTSGQKAQLPTPHSPFR